MPTPPHRRLPPLVVGLAWLGGGAVAAALAGALVVLSGAYDVAGDTPHSQLVYSALEITKVQSVRRRARDIGERFIDTPAQVQRGAACYARHCLACHGAPGVAAAPTGLAMQPLPGPLTDAANQWQQRELVWIVRHGIRMSGMPAWRERLADDDIWATAAFMQRMPSLSPRGYAELAAEVSGVECPIGGERDAAIATLAQTSGRDAIKRHACHGCHQIPGIVGSERYVGPPLDGFARRTQIAGRLPNTPANLVAWLRDPQAIKPHSAMPATGVGQADAEAIAAYLGRLH